MEQQINKNPINIVVQKKIIEFLWNDEIPPLQTKLRYALVSRTWFTYLSLLFTNNRSVFNVSKSKANVSTCVPHITNKHCLLKSFATLENTVFTDYSKKMNDVICGLHLTNTFEYFQLQPIYANLRRLVLQFQDSIYLPTLQKSFDNYLKHTKSYKPIPKPKTEIERLLFQSQPDPPAPHLDSFSLNIYTVENDVNKNGSLVSMVLETILNVISPLLSELHHFEFTSYAYMSSNKLVQFLANHNTLQDVTLNINCNEGFQEQLLSNLPRNIVSLNTSIDTHFDSCLGKSTKYKYLTELGVNGVAKAKIQTLQQNLIQPTNMSLELTNRFLTLVGSNTNIKVLNTPLPFILNSSLLPVLKDYNHLTTFDLYLKDRPDEEEAQVPDLMDTLYDEDATHNDEDATHNDEDATHFDENANQWNFAFNSYPIMQMTNEDDLDDLDDFDQLVIPPPPTNQDESDDGEPSPPSPVPLDLVVNAPKLSIGFDVAYHHNITSLSLHVALSEKISNKILRVEQLPNLVSLSLYDNYPLIFDQVLELVGNSKSLTNLVLGNSLLVVKVDDLLESIVKNDNNRLKLIKFDTVLNQVWKLKDFIKHRNTGYLQKILFKHRNSYNVDDLSDSVRRLGFSIRKSETTYGSYELIRLYK